jgi:hypothetical protein
MVSAFGTMRIHFIKIYLKMFLEHIVTRYPVPYAC